MDNQGKNYKFSKGDHRESVLFYQKIRPLKIREAGHTVKMDSEPNLCSDN